MLCCSSSKQPLERVFAYANAAAVLSKAESSGACDISVGIGLNRFCV